jgi:hypothetical protein
VAGKAVAEGVDPEGGRAAAAGGGLPDWRTSSSSVPVVEALNAIYGTDFLGFCYGFRAGRSPHRALDALAAGIYRRKVNWLLDADIRGF